MKLRNPWIDPRVFEVKPVDAEAYLVQHGWKRLEAVQPNMIPYACFCEGKDGPIVCVPQLDQARDYPQRIIELLTELALVEDRYAVDVLNELLQAKNLPETPNGHAKQRPAETPVA
jgi:hypothetical protein